jgi:hypothetical protein
MEVAGWVGCTFLFSCVLIHHLRTHFLQLSGSNLLLKKILVDSICPYLLLITTLAAKKNKN